MKKLSMQSKTPNIREAIKNRIREIDNQPEEMSLLEKVGNNFRDKLDASEVKKQVLDNKTGKPQMFISADTLDRYINLRVAKRVRFELKKQNANPR